MAPLCKDCTYYGSSFDRNLGIRPLILWQVGNPNPQKQQRLLLQPEKMSAITEILLGEVVHEVSSVYAKQCVPESLIYSLEEWKKAFHGTCSQSLFHSQICEN